VTKSEITNQLHKALDKTHKVITFNSNKPVGKGMKSITDHLLINRTGVGIWWLEVKLGKDKLNEEQIAFKEMIEKQEKKKI